MKYDFQRNNIFTTIFFIDLKNFSPVGTSIFAKVMFNIFRVMLYNCLIFHLLEVENNKRRFIWRLFISYTIKNRMLIIIFGTSKHQYVKVHKCKYLYNYKCKNINYKNPIGEFY